jgi:hypothetical protein
MAKQSSYDCVYYYVGGWARGTWRKAKGQELSVLRREIERMGYHCVYGNALIGPPEGAPLAMRKEGGK